MLASCIFSAVLLVFDWFGHDEIHPWLAGVQGKDNMYPIKLHSVDKEEREEALTFLVGGSEDGRSLEVKYITAWLLL